MSDTTSTQALAGRISWSDAEATTALARLPVPTAGSWEPDPEDDRRRHRRRPLEVSVEMYGYDTALSLVHSYGTTLNVSSGGLYANVDLPLPVGTRTVIAVRSEHPALTPQILRGRVVRCDEGEAGAGIAVAFSAEHYAF